MFNEVCAKGSLLELALSHEERSAHCNLKCSKESIEEEIR